MKYKESVVDYIPEHWNIAKVKDFADVKGGKRLPKGKQLISEPNSHPYIRIRDLGKSKYLQINSEFEYVDDETQKTISRYIVNEGDILISVVGTIGLIGIVGETLDNANQTENCDKIVNITGVIPEYLYYYLISNFGQEEIRKGTVGAVQPKLPLKNVQDITVVYPSYEGQKNIVDILSSIDAKIELNNKINNNLEEQAQACFKSWFIDAPEASSWETGTFSDVIETMIAGDWGKDSPTGNNTEMVYCIRGADIPDVKSGNKGKMPTRFILPKNYATKHLVAGDVVVEISGGSPTQSTGRIASISQSLLDRYDKGMVCTNFCKAMKPKSGYSMFVYYYWQYLYDKNVFFIYENGTTGIKNLDISGFIETEPIILPPAELVEKFDAFCHSVFDVIFANGLQNEQLANIRDALLPKLISGELDVSNIDL
jgi:type I restriction enzyme S subunit